MKKLEPIPQFKNEEEEDKFCLLKGLKITQLAVF